MTALLLVAGGLGALGRVEVAWLLERRGLGPRATTVVNLVGALAAGIALATTDTAVGTGRILTVGFLGGFTTFSTWMLEATTEDRPAWTTTLLVPRPWRRSRSSSFAGSCEPDRVSQIV